MVEIQYEDVLLKSCEGKNLDKKKMLEKYENQLTYVTLSDHKIMDITIYMTKKKWCFYNIFVESCKSLE